MKKVIIATFLAVGLLSCKTNDPVHPQSIEKAGTTPAKDEFLMDEVRHGLHRITLDDSTQILIYRGVESCTMIQIK